MRRMLKCLLAALWIMMVLMLPAAQADDDGEAWMNEACPKTGIHKLLFEDIQIGDCTHDSIVRWYCPDCGKSHTSIEPAPGHQWDDGVVTTAATCTTDGVKTYTCTRLITNTWCGATYTETIPALGHDWDSGVVTAAATCTADGVKTYTCSRCGMTKTETIPATGHTAVSVPAVAATCTAGGKTEGSQCSVCGAILTAQTDTAALGHSWDSGVVTTAATCTAAGVKTYTCSRCGTTKTETIPATGHSPETIPAVAATCEGKGKSEGSRCSACGTILVPQEDTANLGHDFQVTDSKAATATEDGYRTNTCSRCGYTYTEILPKTSHEHTYAVTAETPATCTSDGSRTYSCSICGATYSETIPATGHNWGGWVTIKNPTATEDGLMERVCGNDASHKEQQAIPATGETEAAGSLIVTKIAGDTQQPLAGAHLRVDGPDVVDEWISTTEPHTVEGLVMNETYTLFEVEAPEGYKTADSITFKITGTDPLPLTMVDEKDDGIKPGLLYTSAWAPDAGVGKRYVGAIVYEDDTLINTGDCDLYIPGLDGIGDSVDAPHPANDGKLAGYRLAPGESLTVKNYQDMVCWEDIDKGVLYRFIGNNYNAKYVDKDGIKKYVISNNFEINIPLTYPDGEGPEEKKPQLTLTFLYDHPAKDVYDPEDSVWACCSLVNTGNVPLIAVAHFTSDGVKDYDSVFPRYCDPGEFRLPTWGWPISIKDGITPGTETEDLLGTVTIHLYFKGLDPDTGEELCRSETITRTWKVGKPGFTPWPIPEESDIYGKLTTGASASSAGYQLGELYIVMLEIQNTGKVTIPADGITFSDPSNGQTYSVFSNDFTPGESGIAFGWLHMITEEDVKNGSVYYPPIQLTWTDPDSGNPRTVYTNSLTLNVSNRTGLLLRKDIGNGPENGSYYREGETIPWTLTVTNNSSDPIRNVTVTDQGVTVGTFQEIAAGETVTCNVPPYAVTEYDALVGKVSNYATATGEDLRGTVHTWNSNTVTAPTNPFADPLPPEDGKTGEPKEDPGDPMGAVYGMNVGASVRKEEDGGPMNGSYYELDEEVHFTITVKNTGETTLENVGVMDSLNGFAPIGTAASIAPGAEVPFTFTHQVTQTDIDAGWVTNSATVTYTFDGGKSGTPIQSNPVSVKAGDSNGLNTTSGGGRFTPIPPTTPSGDPLEPVTLPDGTPLTTPDGKPIIAPPGTVPVIGPDGNPVTAPGGVYTGPDGTPVSIPAGTPVLKLPDGSYCVIGSDGRAILTDADGNPILDENGFVIFPGWSIGSASCELRLDGLGENEANYTLHACADHTEAACNAEEAGKAGDWAGAVRIWREEAEEMYGLFFDAADDEGKAALVQERAAFFAYADAWQALAGDEAAAELLRLKTAKMCCILHTLPDELPDSIVEAIEIRNGETYEETIREIGALNGSDSAVTETYAGAAARTLKDIRTMLAGAKSYNYGDVFERGQRSWQIALDNVVNTVYKTADKETRKLIIAWRTALDTLYEAEKPLLEMLYPENDTTVWEELMNLYKDRVFDSAKIQ